MLAVDISTVAGRLMITGLSWPSAKISVTSSHTRLANGSSVPVNDSGEYS